MKKTMIILASVATLIPYSAAYALAYLLKMKDREDMSTPAEWLTLYRDVEDEEEEEWERLIW